METIEYEGKRYTVDEIVERINSLKRNGIIIHFHEVSTDKAIMYLPNTCLYITEEDTWEDILKKIIQIENSLKEKRNKPYNILKSKL